MYRTCDRSEILLFRILTYLREEPANDPPKLERCCDKLTSTNNRIGFVQDKKIPYVWQSSLTNSYIDDIIEKSDCDLSTLENSAKLHKVMLKSFRNLLKENYNREVVDCPIT